MEKIYLLVSDPDLPNKDDLEQLKALGFTSKEAHDLMTVGMEGAQREWDERRMLSQQGERNGH